ncbi:hypothetical protein CASP1_00029 [Alcaligenes phage CASP1]|nr:hypothetical protein CASP1_00029 [Alcaligenes phage CASP1]
MSFFQLSDGTNAAQNATGEFESGGGDIAPIPKNTNVLASCDEAKVSEYQGDRYVDLRWVVLQPEEYKNRKVFQKIRVWDADSEKRDKAIRMLVAIDANCGGKLAASGQEPNDINLQQAVLNRPMVLNLQVWEMNDKKGNWVSKVSPRKNQQQQQQPAPVQQAPVDLDQDIPF